MIDSSMQWNVLKLQLENVNVQNEKKKKSSPTDSTIYMFQNNTYKLFFYCSLKLYCFSALYFNCVVANAVLSEFLKATISFSTQFKKILF